MKPEPALRVEAARKRYGKIEALAGLSFEVGAGEWVALLGPNGAGKSTLMRAICGLVDLEDGRIELFGERRQRRSADRVRAAELVGLVPQEIALYPLLTVEENLRVFGRLHGVGEALSRRLAWALEWTGLERRAGDRVGQLSGGMKRRLNIACGVLHQPRLVLLDEPTVGVDPQGRRRIWEMLDSLRRGGAALVQSTHELHEIEAVCDRMLIVDHGRVLADGTVDELIEATLGRQAALRLTLDRSAEGLLPKNGFEVRGDTLRGRVGDLTGELPSLLSKLRGRGLSVRDLHVERPSLEEVFTRLTGRELRE